MYIFVNKDRYSSDTKDSTGIIVAPVDTVVCGSYVYLFCEGGVFRRHANYWEHSPYGWEKVDCLCVPFRLDGPDWFWQGTLRFIFETVTEDGLPLAVPSRVQE